MYAEVNVPGSMNLAWRAYQYSNTPGENVAMTQQATAYLRGGWRDGGIQYRIDNKSLSN